MKSRRAPLLVTLLGLHSAACVALGYDFDEYGPATANGGGTGLHTQSTLAAGAGGQAEAGEGGNGGGGRGRSETDCEPQGCWEAEAQCGPIDDGCGKALDCGPCFWWFEECAQNYCIIP